MSQTQQTYDVCLGASPRVDAAHVLVTTTDEESAQKVAGVLAEVKDSILDAKGLRSFVRPSRRGNAPAAPEAAPSPTTEPPAPATASPKTLVTGIGAEK